MDRIVHRGLAGIYVGRLHPLRILLLAPIHIACLAAHQLMLAVIGHQHVVLERIADDGVDIVEPLAVAGRLIDLPCGHCPDDAVGAAGPCAAGAGVLDDAVAAVHLGPERLHADLGMELREREDDAVADVARPYAAPCDAGAEGGVGLNSQDALLERHVVERRLQHVRTFVVRQMGDIGVERPAATVDLLRVHVVPHLHARFQRHIVAGHLGGRHGTSAELSLKDFVASPLIFTVLVIYLRPGRRT